MLKLYHTSGKTTEYWETWDNDDGSATIHWGVLGTRGTSKKVKGSFFRKTHAKVQGLIDNLVSKGFAPVPIENHITLLIEYAVDGMGTPEDLEKRYRLQERMNETLGWTGLGHCDGGSIGSGTMEVCNYVVDFSIARQVIENDLEETEFANYTRIYDENT